MRVNQVFSNPVTYIALPEIAHAVRYICPSNTNRWEFWCGFSRRSCSIGRRPGYLTNICCTYLWVTDLCWPGRSYKASLPYQICLNLCKCFAYQVEWWEKVRLNLRPGDCKSIHYLSIWNWLQTVVSRQLDIGSVGKKVQVEQTKQIVDSIKDGG